MKRTTTEIKLPKYVARVLDRLRRGAVLCRQVSGTEEARRGGVYLFHASR